MPVWLAVSAFLRSTVIPKSEPDDLEGYDEDVAGWLEPPTTLTGREQGEKLKAMISNPILLDPDDSM